jgi:hypothetical protein
MSHLILSICQNPKEVGSTQHLEGRGRQISEFEASLVYKVSSRTARAIQRNPVLKNNDNNNNNNEKEL